MLSRRPLIELGRLLTAIGRSHHQPRASARGRDQGRGRRRRLSFLTDLSSSASHHVPSFPLSPSLLTLPPSDNPSNARSLVAHLAYKQSLSFSSQAQRSYSASSDTFQTVSVHCLRTISSAFFPSRPLATGVPLLHLLGAAAQGAVSFLDQKTYVDRSGR